MWVGWRRLSTELAGVGEKWLWLTGLLYMCPFKTVMFNTGLLLQSPPHLVNDATLLQHPWEQNIEASHSSNIAFSSLNSAQWGNSYPATTSVCQHHINSTQWGNSYPATTSVCPYRVNAETASTYNGRLQLEAVPDAHQMALRPPSDLESTVFRDLLDCDVYNPELGVTENPEYFHINSLLFAAHQLRSQRYGYYWTVLHLFAVCDILFIFILQDIPIYFVRVILRVVLY